MKNLLVMVLAAALAGCGSSDGPASPAPGVPPDPARANNEDSDVPAHLFEQLLAVLGN